MDNLPGTIAMILMVRAAMANGARYDIKVEWKRNGVVYISIECIFQLPPYALIPKWIHGMAGGE